MTTHGNPLSPAGSPDPTTLMEAVVNTVAYADIFDYPLTAAEIHRYLKGVAAPAGTIQKLLDNSALVPSRLVCRDGYYTLPGREATIDTRRQREQIATRLWPAARHYGRQIAGLPFVRFVAVTGSLAVNNPIDKADIDYFVVTVPGRVWLSRAMTILIVRLAARQRVHLCPNYFLSAEKLAFSEQSLYAAHELVQMVPLNGRQVYQDLWTANDWVLEYLPNAATFPAGWDQPEQQSQSAARRGLEALLSTRPGDWLEQWEMKRKIAKFTDQAGPGSEAAFCADWCKGHFDNHRQNTLEAYSGRVHPPAG